MKAQELLKKLKVSTQSKEKIQNLLREGRHKRMIEYFEKCAACHSLLRFVYFKQVPNTIMERAHCDCCGQNSKTRTFSLN